MYVEHAFKDASGELATRSMCLSEGIDRALRRMFVLACTQLACWCSMIQAGFVSTTVSMTHPCRGNDVAAMCQKVHLLAETHHLNHLVLKVEMNPACSHPCGPPATDAQAFLGCWFKSL